KSVCSASAVLGGKNSKEIVGSGLSYSSRIRKRGTLRSATKTAARRLACKGPQGRVFEPWGSANGHSTGIWQIRKYQGRQDDSITRTAKRVAERSENVRHYARKMSAGAKA